MCAVKRLTLMAFGAALLALALSAAPAQAQGQIPLYLRPHPAGGVNPYNIYDPYHYSRQAAFNIALYGRAMSQVPPYALGYNPYPQIVNTPYPYSPPIGPYSPYGGGYGGSIVNNPAGYTSPGYGGTGYMSPGYTDGGYSNSYLPYYDPYSGFLRGAADVINADGRFRINNQQANLTREQVYSAHLDNRRKAFEEFIYERDKTPTWLDDLERQRKLNLRSAVSNPPGSEILAATALNTILDNLKQMQAKGTKGPPVELDQDLLKQINVTAGGGANVGLLKNDGQLSWPIALTGSEFDEDRKNVERNIRGAVREAEFNTKVDQGRLKTLMADVDKMTEHLGDRIGEMTGTQYIEAKNYLKLLNDALRALQQPDGMNYFNGKYKAQGKNVGELVEKMSGLKFAPATPGDERAYRDLHERLVKYYHQSQPLTRE